MSEKSEQPHQEDAEKNIERQRLELQVRQSVAELFDNNESGVERVSLLLGRVEKFLKSELIDGESIKSSIEQLAGVTDREEFIQRAFDCLEPVRNLRLEHKEEFDRLRDEEAPLTEINKIFAYGMEEDLIHIHLRLSGLPIKDVKELFLQGLYEVAKVVEKNENIGMITASSWIIAKNPGIIKKLGFVVDETDPKHSTISREEFLNRYLR